MLADVSSVEELLIYSDNDWDDFDSFVISENRGQRNGLCLG